MSNYGIPLRIHPDPDMRAKAKELARIAAAYKVEEKTWNAEFNAAFDSCMKAGTSGDHDAVDAALAPAKARHDAVCAALRERTKAALAGLDPSLYRFQPNGWSTTVGIRFDKVGKAAWDREYVRLRVECEGTGQPVRTDTLYPRCPVCGGWAGKGVWFRMPVHLPGWESGSSILKPRA